MYARLSYQSIDTFENFCNVQVTILTNEHVD